MKSAVETNRIVEMLRANGQLVSTSGSLPLTVSGITDHSSHVEPGYVFVAVRGAERDGHAYLRDATARGMGLAIVEEPGITEVPSIVVRESRKAVALAARAFYGDPGAELSIFGVTGTSGKTTVTSMLRHLASEPDRQAASIGTLGVLTGSIGEPFPGGWGLTTPGPVELQRLLRAMCDREIRTIAMEVSSHALDQDRVAGLEFDAAVFTNLSRDHLDYHGTFESYFDAKAKLAAQVASDGVAVVNADDAVWKRLRPSSRIVRFGLTSKEADVRASNLVFAPSGSTWTLQAGGESTEVSLPLIGDFNVANALAAAAVMWARGMKLDTIGRRLSTLPQVSGRLELLLEHPAVLRDYAHKPDALERALDAVRPFVPGRLIVVFGCGGDRDRGKRPIMGEIAERKADVVIITSDNPRTEDPEAILDEIEEGMKRRDHIRVEDRHEAIRRAMQIASEGSGDLVVLAGKGHETYQIRGTTSYPFDEKDVVSEVAGALRT